MNLLIHCRAGRKTKRHNKATKCETEQFRLPGHGGALSPVQQLVALCLIPRNLSARCGLYLHNALNSR
jgi:hypothetical protein